MKIQTMQKVMKHGKELNDLFKTEFEDVLLCKKLRRLELKLNNLATNYCNGIIETEEWDDINLMYLGKIDKILKFREKNIPVFINADARGYQIKIEDDYIHDNNIQIHRDWGGYGIIAPNLN